MNPDQFFRLAEMVCNLSRAHRDLGGDDDSAIFQLKRAIRMLSQRANELITDVERVPIREEAYTTIKREIHKLGWFASREEIGEIEKEASRLFCVKYGTARIPARAPVMHDDGTLGTVMVFKAADEDIVKDAMHAVCNK